MKEKLLFPYIWLRDHYRNFHSRRSWKYFYKYINEPNIHTNKIHAAIFGEGVNEEVAHIMSKPAIKFGFVKDKEEFKKRISEQ